MFDKDNKFGFISNNENSNNTDIKKYIDDNTIIHPLPVYKKVESPSMIMYMVNIMDLKEYTAYGAVLDMNTTKYQRCRFIYICDDGKNKVICSTGDNLNDTTFRVSHYDTSSRLEHGNAIYSVDYTKHNTPTDVVVKITLRNYLGIYNSTEYTPEEDYNPATKKYVDDNKIAYTVSSKVLTTVSASNVKLNNEITINNISFNKDRKYYIEFLGIKKLCNLSISETTELTCIINDYGIQGIGFLSNLIIYIGKINKDDTTTDTFTDLVIYEEEVKCLDNKYLENNLIIQNSISMGRVGNIGTCSSAIGSGVTASGMFSHAEGYITEASGNSSHAEGSSTEAIGETSHAEGYWTKASSDYQHVQGKCNIEDTEGKYAHIVGNGKDGNTRSNAHTLDWEGNGWYSGKLSQEGTPTEDKDLTTKKYVDDNLSNMFAFNEAGELVVTINGVSKTFVPKE
mgnify:CR=1 FL=1